MAFTLEHESLHPCRIPQRENKCKEPTDCMHCLALTSTQTCVSRKTIILKCLYTITRFTQIHLHFIYLRKCLKFTQLLRKTRPSRIRPFRGQIRNSLQSSIYSILSENCMMTRCHVCSQQNKHRAVKTFQSNVAEFLHQFISTLQLSKGSEGSIC